MREFREAIRDYYIEGIVWNMKYYYEGCQSWSWFFPFYYAPFPSDLKGISHLQNLEFDMGSPFKPLEQLMAVLPPYSRHALPSCLQELMMDEESEIIDFYPDDFYVDLRGKGVAWLGEVILPFIEEKRLRKAISKKDQQLSEKEKQLGKKGTELIFYNINQLHLDVELGQIGLVKGKFETEELSSVCESEFGELIRYAVKVCKYSHPDSGRHICKMLDGADNPPRYLPEEVRKIF